jgi:diketogulonate reductase-like aldo/keto reductase
LPTKYKLNNGLEIPAVGLGTFQHQEKASMIHAIMEAGYVHIDTATVYENEACVGETLQECFANGKKREDIFVTTKLWKSSYSDPEAALRESLKKLQLDYVDLYLIHWPHGYYSDPQVPLH